VSDSPDPLCHATQGQESVKLKHENARGPPAPLAAACYIRWMIRVPEGCSAGQVQLVLQLLSVPVAQLLDLDNLHKCMPLEALKAGWCLSGS
jgi:hypothetical protein